MSDEAILLVSCKDQRGITAAISNFVYEHNGSIIHADQHIDDLSNTFFMRIEWSLEGFLVAKERIAAEFQPVAERFHMQWNLYFSDERIRTAIFVSRHLHCLYDLLYRVRVAELKCQVPVIVSNHPDAQDIAREFGVEYVLTPVTPENKCEQEARQREALAKHHIDLVVLARYHQILSAEFVEEYRNRIINIHHSFLPAFPGQNPYARAYRKGVKIIGATSHYVTAELDEGPIIEQDTVRVSHSDSLDRFKQKGSDLERVVLSRAVRWHLERKVLCYNHKTVIFD
ncbi:MAG: formyltetrahydrofolate deformylase [Candidatus Omnitrophica bacterium]|nr:formyltetrahydrofolate deformylase [Candidatus Omnitrophota bacterium]